MSMPASASAARDPLAGFDLDTLLAGAARLRPGRMALSDGRLDDPRALTYGALEAKVSIIAGAWRELGVEAGERVLIIADSRPAPVIALLGALRARLDVALLTSAATGEDIAQFAQEVGAVALAGEPADEDDGLEDLLFAAASAQSVRLVASLGHAVDGAGAIEEAGGTPVTHRTGGARARIITARSDGSPAVHDQRTLVAAALDFVTQARIGMRTPILTTLAPARFAGLVTGPVAGLMAGAPVVLHWPFHGPAFVDLLEGLGCTHLVAPGRLLGPLAAAGLVQPSVFASLTLLERCERAEDIAGIDSASVTLSGRLPAIVDLIAVDEQDAVTEPRGPNGAPAPLAISTHTLTLDGQTIVAIELARIKRRVNGELVEEIEMRGAAVSPLEGAMQ